MNKQNFLINVQWNIHILDIFGVSIIVDVERYLLFGGIAFQHPVFLDENICPSIVWSYLLYTSVR